MRMTFGDVADLSVILFTLYLIGSGKVWDAIVYLNHFF